MEALVQHSAGTSTVLLSGIGDFGSAPEIRRAVNEALDEGTARVAIHLDGMPFMDSTVLGVLIGGHRRAAREGKSFTLCGLSSQTRHVIDSTGLRRVLDIED